MTNQGAASASAIDRRASRRAELHAFLLTTMVLIPGLAVGFVGAYGLVVWCSQMLLGPPGPLGG